MTKTTRRIHGRRGLATLAVALVALSAVAVWVNRHDPGLISQQRLHRMGTTSAKVRMHPLPRQYPVRIEPLAPADWLGLSTEVLPPPLGVAGTAREQGYFDPNELAIHVVGPVARAQASLPVGWMQPTFRHVLRHEYGHAFLYDWLKENVSDEAALVPFVPELRDDPRRYPPGLRPVVREYLSLDDEDVYSRYAMTSFAEYMAESYAWYLEGKRLPPETQRFFDAAGQTR